MKRNVNAPVINAMRPPGLIEDCLEKFLETYVCPKNFKKATEVNKFDDSRFIRKWIESRETGFLK